MSWKLDHKIHKLNSNLSPIACRIICIGCSRVEGDEDNRVDMDDVAARFDWGRREDDWALRKNDSAGATCKTNSNQRFLLRRRSSDALVRFREQQK